MRPLDVVSNIYLIGLGGAGKSTVGCLLAEKIGYRFIDLDTKFKNKFGDITIFIDEFGKAKYNYLNSELFCHLLQVYKERTVFPLPPGLVFSKNKRYHSLNKKHSALLRNKGTSILLLPSKNKNVAKEILTRRQIGRGLGYIKADCDYDVDARFDKFLTFGDLKIFSAAPPGKIVDMIINKLNHY